MLGTRKNVIFFLATLLFLAGFACSGALGPPGPAGPQGERGVAGQSGATGSAGPADYVFTNGFVYTVESFRAAYDLVRAGGLLSVSFVAGQEWLAHKLTA